MLEEPLDEREWRGWKQEHPVLDFDQRHHCLEAGPQEEVPQLARCVLLQMEATGDIIEELGDVVRPR